MKVPVSVIIFFLFNLLAHCQIDWTITYYDDKDAYLETFIESYDNGYLIVGRHGSNYPNWGWIIKTDINGEILWEKTFGSSNSVNAFLSVTQRFTGAIFLAGTTTEYDELQDAIIMKLDSCGNKEWCKILHFPGLSYAVDVITNENGDCIVLSHSPLEMEKNRVSLASFSEDGLLQWEYYYNSTDPSLVNSEGRSIISTADKGYLITGDCGYKDPDPPYYYRAKPYYIKVDSNGIFEWEKVVHKDSGGEAGGWAWSSVLNPDSTYYYSSISHNYPDSRAPAIIKLDISGNVIDIYDIVEGYNHGGVGDAEFLNDSTLVCSLGWGNTEDDLKYYAAFIDTVGNLIDTTLLVQDIYTVYTHTVYDNKLAFMFNTFQNNQFDAHLVKLNMQLENDSFYTYPFQYDTLCPYSIQSDTLFHEGCDIIVGIHDYQMPDTEEDLMEIYPNPARHFVNIRYSICDIRYSIHTYDMFGRLMEEIIVPSGQDEGQIDISHYPDGIYVAVLRDEGIILGSKKFVVKH